MHCRSMLWELAVCAVWMGVANSNRDPCIVYPQNVSAKPICKKYVLRRDWGIATREANKAVERVVHWQQKSTGNRNLLATNHERWLPPFQTRAGLRMCCRKFGCSCSSSLLWNQVHNLGESTIICSRLNAFMRRKFAQRTVIVRQLPSSQAKSNASHLLAGSRTHTIYGICLYCISLMVVRLPLLGGKSCHHVCSVYFSTLCMY